MSLTRMLPVELSVKEVRLRHERLITCLGQIEQQELHFAELKAEERAIIKDLVGNKDELLKQIREGHETRSVECEEREVFGQNAVQIVRLDTSAVVEERPMTAEQRQGDLDLGDDEEGGDDG